jgi:hypothetical protein
MGLTVYGREAGKNTKSGVKSDVYLIAHTDLKNASGKTETYSTAVSGLITEIGIASASTKFVKYGAVVGQNGIKEEYIHNDGDNSYDINKELTFSLSNVGTVEGKKAVEDLISNPVAALVQLRNGVWVAFGLNGQMMAKNMSGSVDSGSNGRTITLSGSDEHFLQVVDPSIIAGLIA